MDANSVPFQAVVIGSTLYYPGSPATVLTVNAVENFNPGDAIGSPGVCSLFGPMTIAAGTEQTDQWVPLVPPFTTVLN